MKPIDVVIDVAKALQDWDGSPEQAAEKLGSACRAIKNYTSTILDPGGSAAYHRGKLEEAMAEIARLNAIIAEGATREGELREAVRSFAWEMEHKLRKHDGDYGPEGWKMCDPNFLWNRMRDEINEAKKATSTQNIIEECADIANFAMMIADNAARALQV